MTYYSPTPILTDSQKCPLTFDLSVPHLTALNNGSAITAGTKLDLPLWLAEMLAVTRPAGPSSSSLGSLDLPPALGVRVMNALRADPKSVDVRAQAQWFYGLAERLFELFEEEEMVGVISDTFKQRALEIADKAQNTRTTQQGGSDASDFMSGLDDAERQLFRAAHDGSNSVKKWFESSSHS
ncbi:GINS complex, Psf3 component [Teratosphaeria nubilosa]|uniref:DNA replication complex GINS protein PSF3 n=1 Tax=Teratosphaeria nubilosa TaxID=161662 RepID=A0A6G1L0B5_9PEZI|nr:GINS complex, Psf3 component [Teratosphaeria nubilosa]